MTQTAFHATRIFDRVSCHDDAASRVEWADVIAFRPVSDHGAAAPADFGTLTPRLDASSIWLAGQPC
ncbi:MAG: hypothetical protein DI616_18760 [Paracoccus denitrificans]|uniref:Uncharacterized protein n=1 Tax=Paracoccus denitrificans TaxID=266 RepID=A0A533HZH5_PARDE|nr:MAG: hypothetical protein DI616_18760 [Paracoccus denitrificans]